MDAADQSKDIDFAVLRQIDREIDDALARGEWSAALYTSLYSRGLKAVSDNVRALHFLLELREPGWSDAHKDYVIKRLPRQVRELIRLLSDGWEPFVALPDGSAISWKDQQIDVSRVEVLLRPDGAKLTAHLKPGAAINLEGFASRRVSFGDTLHAEFAHGWKLDSPSSVHTGTSTKTSKGSPSRIIFQFTAQDIRLSRGEVRPTLWVVPLGENITIPHLGNISRDRLILSSNGSSYSIGFIGIRLQGMFPYTLIKVARAEKKEAFFLIAENGDVDQKDDFIDKDILALQLTLGQTLNPGLAYGIHGDQLVGVRQIRQWASNKVQARTVPLEPVYGGSVEHWYLDFFEHLSIALQKASTNEIAAVIQLFLRSYDPLLDISIQHLLSAIALLSSLSADELNSNLGKRVKTYLTPYGIEIPNELEKDLDHVAQQFTKRGQITLDISASQTQKYIDLRDKIRTVLVAMISLKIGYRGPIVGDRYSSRPPLWWPRASVHTATIRWSATLAPEDAACGLKTNQILVLVERPEHEKIARWLLDAANIPCERLKFESVHGHEGLLKYANLLKKISSPTIIIISSLLNHLPTAIDAIRAELSSLSSDVLVCPAVSCMEAWLFADDDLVRQQILDDTTQRQVLEHLPEELSDARTLAHRIFGPPDLWSDISRPDVYRAAERSPSLRRFLELLTTVLDIKVDFPAQSVSRAISRNAIAGLIRDLLDKDTIAWRTADESIFTAEALAREVEQGTETGRQYTVDLISMMINTLSRNARRKGSQ